MRRLDAVKSPVSCADLLPRGNRMSGRNHGAPVPLFVGVGVRVSGPGFDDPNASALPTAPLRPDDDLHVLSERGQQAHEPLAGEVGKAPVEKSRDFRLVDAHERRGGRLGQVLALDDVPNMARELSFCEFLFRLSKAQVCKDVARAWDHCD